jgi:ADP-ribosylglycohydrolase
MNNIELARKSLNGLWVGDCIGNLGQLYFAHDILKALENGEMMGGIKINNVKGTFHLSDDTEEAIVLYCHLIINSGSIDQDKLAMEFATRYMERDPDGEKFGYGLMTRKVLRDIYEGKHWKEANKTQRKIEGPSYVDKMVSTVAQGGDIKSVISALQNEYKDQGLTKPEKVGSCGNGSAMRVAPLGAYLFDKNINEIIEAAKKSAETTHDHLEGVAGAIAISLSSAYVAHIVDLEENLKDADLLNIIYQYIPVGEVKNGIIKALDISFDTPLKKVIEILGNGTHVTCQDTVPFCCWMAAKALKLYNIDEMYEKAIIDTSMAFGDVDTNCAIVGGIIGIASKPPLKWVKYCQSMEGVIGDLNENDSVDIKYTPEQQALIDFNIKELNRKDKEGITEYHDYESVIERYKKDGYKSE